MRGVFFFAGAVLCVSVGCSGSLDERYLADGVWTWTISLLLDGDDDTQTTADQYSLDVVASFNLEFDSANAGSTEEWPYILTNGAMVSATGGAWRGFESGKSGDCETDDWPSDYSTVLHTESQELDLISLPVACVTKADPTYNNTNILFSSLRRSTSGSAATTRAPSIRA